MVMRTNEAIRQTIQDLISGVNNVVVEEDFEFDGKAVKAFLFLPSSLAGQSEEVAKAVFTEDVLEDNSDEEVEAPAAQEPAKQPAAKKPVAKKAAKKKAK